MEYFKDTFASVGSNWDTEFTDMTKMVVCRKHHNVASAGAYNNKTITCSHEGMPYTLVATSNGWRPTALTDNISSGVFPVPVSETSDTIHYGDYSFSSVDCFTFYCESGATNLKYNRTVCNWTDGTHNYTFHVFDDNSTTHRASCACDDLDLMKPSASFTYPVVKDFDILTGRKACNSGSSNYVLQPVVAFGGKTPIYTIVGSNNAQLPWFTEIQAGDLTFFTIGSNFAIIK